MIKPTLTQRAESICTVIGKEDMQRFAELTSSGNAVVMYMSEHCSTCSKAAKYLSRDPGYQEFVKEHGAKSIFIEVNSNPNFKEQLNGSKYPLFQAWVDGNVVRQVVGNYNPFEIVNCLKKAFDKY